MEGTITAILPQPRRNGQRFNVFVNGRYAFSLQAELAARLRVGEALSAEDVDQLLGRDLDQRAIDSALAYLAHRPRSEQEVRRRLEERYPAATIERAMEKLRHWKLVDDDAFARYWVEQRQHFRPRGARVLRQELRLKGIPADLAEEAASELGGEAEAAYQAAAAQARRLRTVDQPAFRQRLSAFLARRGFEWDSINSAVRRAWHDLHGDDESDES